MKKISIIISVLLMAFAVNFANAQGASTKEVTVSGIGDTAESARANALRKAVKSVVGEYLDVRSDAKNEELEESIISLSAGYVESSKELEAPSKDANGVWHIKLAAVVKSEKIQEKVTRFKETEQAVDFSKFKTQKERKEAFEKFFVQGVSDFAKVIKVDFDKEIEQTDDGKGIVLKYKISANPREWMNVWKPLYKGIMASGLISTSYSHEKFYAILPSGKCIDLYFQGDDAYQIKNRIQSALSHLYVAYTIDCLDSEGEVLQTEKLWVKIWEWGCMLTSDKGDGNLNERFLNFEKFKYEGSVKILFDIPEDVEKVKSVRGKLFLEEQKQK